MTLIYFILVLGITVFIHELGHFIFAKRAGVHIYEFAIGMGPRIFKWKRKNDDTIYDIRLFPIGGFVSMAGEDTYDDKNIPKEKHLIFRPWKDRFLTIIAGIVFNFLLAIVLLFIVGLVNGCPNTKPVISSIESGYPIEEYDVEVGDQIIKYNSHKIGNVDKLVLLVSINKGDETTFVVKKDDGSTKEFKIKPTLVEENDTKTYKFGFVVDSSREYGIIPAIKYAFTKTASLIEQMVLIISFLITGTVSLNNLSGPVGIYGIVGETAKSGLLNLVYLTAYLCINVGFVNLIPFPAFDGGRALFLIIEKIRKKPINSKIENTIHTIGFYLLMLLMILVTYNDIIRLIK